MKTQEQAIEVVNCTPMNASETSHKSESSVSGKYFSVTLDIQEYVDEQLDAEAAIKGEQSGWISEDEFWAD